MEVIYENQDVIILTNGAGEIFIKNKEDGVNLRLNVDSMGIKLSYLNSNTKMEPLAFKTLLFSEDK